LGDVNVQLGDLAAARDGYQKGREVYQQVANDDPLNAEKQAKLAYSFGRLGDLEARSEDVSAAIACFNQGVEILGKLDESGKLASRPLHQRWLAQQRKALEACQTAARAIDSLEFALARPKQEIAALLGIRSRALARHGQHADASTTAEKLAALEPIDGENLFQAAEAFALCADGTKPANSPDNPHASETTIKSHSAARAIELIKQAHVAGYFTYPDKRAKLSEDPNLGAIRGLDDYKKLVADISSVAPNPRPPIFKKWTYRADERGDAGSFEMGDSEWVELKKGKFYARFKLTETTPDFVELYDKSRKMWVRLSQTTASYTTDQKKWFLLYDGTPVREDTSQTVSSQLLPPAADQPKFD
jgi:tetratricopeptide (TPR) repeat protein